MNKIAVLALVLCAALNLPAETAKERNAAARAALTDGVGAIDAPNALPGPYVCLTEDAFGVVPARNYDQTIHPMCVGAFYGEGRVLAFGHPNFIFKTGHLYDTKRFLENSFRWLAKGGEVKVGVVKNAGVADLVKELGFECKLSDSLDEALECPVIAFYPDVIRPGEYAKVHDYVKRGGGFMTAALAWGWRYGVKESGKSSIARYYEIEKLFAPFGFIAGDMGTNRSADGGRGYDAKLAFPVGTTLPEAFEILEADPSLGTTPHAAQVSKTLVQTAACYPPDKSALFAKMGALAEAGAGKEIPSPAKPFKDSDSLLSRVALIMRQNAWQADPAALRPADPAAASYPGLVAANAVRLTGQKRVIDLSVPRWHSTGLFAPAGETITVKLPEGAERDGLSVRIGTTADDVTSNGEWKRAPTVSMTLPLALRETRVASPFGGLVYIVAPDGKSGTREVEIDGAVRAPWFKLGRDTNADWERALAECGAPQAELEGDSLVITADIRNAAQVKDAEALVKFWDGVLALDAKLAGLEGEPRRSPERICSDVQLASGLLHDGYPVMYYLDPKGLDEVLDLERIRRRGAWGFFHEIGHNHQNRAWTFSGLGEVSVNLFTLYNFEKALGIDARKAYPGQTDFESASEKVMDFRESKYTFDGFKSDPFLGLEAFTRLKEVYGWELFEKTFREYRDPAAGAPPKDDQERIDQLATRMSRVSGNDLAEYFMKWRWPVSEAARAECAKYPKAEDERLWMFLDDVPEDAVVKLHLSPEKHGVSVEQNWTVFKVHFQAEARQRRLVGGLRSGKNWRLRATVRDETAGREYKCDYKIREMAKDLRDKTFNLQTRQLGMTPEPGHAYTVGFEVFDGETLKYEGVSEKGAFSTFSEDFILYGPTDYEPAVKRRANSPLKGVRALFLGDSITEAICEVHNARLCYTAGWPGRIGWANDMRWMNRGRSGATLSGCWGLGNQIRGQLRGLDDCEFDLIVTHGGINDGMANAKCGEIAPGTPDEFDGVPDGPATFAHGLEHLFWAVRKYHPEAKPCYIINYQVTSNVWDNCGPQFAEFIPTAKKICEKWGVPYVDLWNSESVTAQTRPGSRTAFGDGLHANDRGYDIVYPYIEEFVESVWTGRAKPGEEYRPRDHFFNDPTPDVVTGNDVNVALGKPAYTFKGGWETGGYTDGDISGRARTGGTTTFENSEWNKCSVTVDLGALYTVDKVRAFTGLGNGVSNWAAFGSDDLNKPFKEWKLLYRKDGTRMSTALGTSGAFKPADVQYVRFVCYTERAIGLMGFTEVEVYGRVSRNNKMPLEFAAFDENDTDVSEGCPRRHFNSQWLKEADGGTPSGLEGDAFVEVNLKGLCEIEKIGVDGGDSKWIALASDDPFKPVAQWTRLGEKAAIYPFARNAKNFHTVAFPKTKARVVRVYCTYSGNRRNWWPGQVKVFGKVLDGTPVEAAHAATGRIGRDGKTHWRECGDPECGARLCEAVHSWGGWTASKPVSGGDPGEIQSKCAVCGEVRAKPAVDPKYGANLAIACKAATFDGKDYPLATDGSRVYDRGWRGVVGGFKTEVTDESGCWVQIDLGEPCEFRAVRICDAQDNNPNFFSVYAGDVPDAPIAEWTKVGEKRNGAVAQTEGYVIEFKPVRARYVRVYATRHNEAFSEIEVYNSPNEELPLRAAKVELPKFFSSNMVLQRGVPVPVFGRAEPGEIVKVRFAGQVHSAVAGDDGRWETALDPLKASNEPATLVAGSVACTNVLVGDVWIFAGSGRLGGEFRRSKEPGAAELSKRVPGQGFVRLAPVNHATADYPDSDLAFGGNFLSKPNRWRCNRDNGAYDSVFAFAFGDRMHGLTKVPVGVVYMPSDGWEWADVSGFTSAKALRETKGLEDFSRRVDALLPETEAGAKALDEFIGRFEEWRVTAAADIAAGRDATVGEAPKFKRLKDGGFCGEFNAMAWPLRRFAAKRFVMFVTNPPEGANRENSKYDLRVEAVKRGLSEAFGGICVEVETIDKERGLIEQGREFAEKEAGRLK